MQQKVVIISALVIIVLLVVGYSFYQSFRGIEEGEEVVESEEEEQISYPVVTPEEVAGGFYNWYVEEGNALPNETYLEKKSLTDTFKEYVRTSTEEEDPIICLIEIPESPTVEVRDTEIKGNRATSVVDIDFVEEGVSFIVELLLDENSWKIDLVLCFQKS